MTVERDIEGKSTQVTHQKDGRQGYVKQLFLASPTVAFTLLYIGVSAIGMFYSWVLYRNFGINIFDHSDVTDFLLAAFKNPVTLLSVVLLAVIGAALAAFIRYWLDHILQRIRREVEEMVRREGKVNVAEESRAEEQLDLELRQIEERLNRRKVVLYGVIAVIVALGFIYSTMVVPYRSANQMASAIKRGEYPTVDVRYRLFSGSAGQVTEPNLELIGATEKAAFFYDDDDGRTIVIPHAQIVSVDVPD
jgi:hypothetical protein